MNTLNKLNLQKKDIINSFIWLVGVYDPWKSIQL